MRCRLTNHNHFLKGEPFEVIDYILGYLLETPLWHFAKPIHGRKVELGVLRTGSVKPYLLSPFENSTLQTTLPGNKSVYT